ncbi:dihydroorotate dehydrogenase electron transfer subunit [Exiguobacterium sp. SL-10]|jgi:dihydroorotate dehydrogenase electron transfer subunit|uniref:dihydroorotate dehydrogenase electron transfer subunit n=1 Tax=unclassified Exiguobacterium TaxID=2644629 RepID=UPI00103B0DD9|nr:MULTISPECIES: dihydroorotate dehydrogenase electron transfer subunit [unclassified Exiguobacterium]TCI23267.1 dihydroorotate dehydrogenase electron transfer subunit [Exiguobacterium sp. SL-9]TCI31790.1 dihydroorotate dehydrogenase electron transfer subunit [Exiguobacterium sp. SL-10]
MRQLATIRSNRLIATATMEMKVEISPQEVAPGTFFHVKTSELLRRPLSVANVEDNVVTFLYKVIGAGTTDLAARRPGDVLDVLGPLGNGFPLEQTGKRVVLVGGGIGVPPLYYTRRMLAARGIETVAILGFDTKTSIFYEDAFRELGETIITTVDGTYGEMGFVTGPLAQVDADVLFSCGPEPMLKAVAASHIEERYISIENRMGCGIGACFACVCQAPGGYVKVCSDGPVFRAEEVTL